MRTIVACLCTALILGVAPSHSRITDCDREASYVAAKLAYALEIHRSWAKHLREGAPADPNLDTTMDRESVIRWHDEWADIYERALRVISRVCLA